MDEVYAVLKKYHTYFIATRDGDQARVRPFGTADLFEGKLYIQTGKVKNVYKQIIANPKVELVCLGEGGDWLRLAGTLVADERVEAKKHMLDEHPNLRGMYDENDDNTAVFYFENATATFNSRGGEPRIVTF